MRNQIVVVVLAALAGVALLPWVLAGIARRAREKRFAGVRLLAILFGTLTLMDAVVCLAIVINAGLGHSARAAAQAPVMCLLSFLLLVVCPVAAAALWSYHAVTGRAKRPALVAAAALAVVVAGMIGRLGAWPPLLYAARHGHSTLAGLLVRVGAPLDDCDRYDGTTPLTAAAWRGDVRTVRVLLDAGADVDGRDRQGTSAIWAAHWRGSAEMTTLLLERGADVMARNHARRTLLAEAALRRDLKGLADLTKYLKTDADRRFAASLQAALASNDEEEIHRLLERDAER